MTIIDGKKISAEIKQELKAAVDKLKAEGKRAPHLAAILVGNNGASEAYVGHKVKACADVGFESTLLRFPETISEAELLAEVEKLNNNPTLDGYIVQLPVPKHIDPDKIIQAIKPEKDVDGFHPVNVGRMCIGHPSYVSATPAGIMELIKRYQIPTEGKNCVVVGRSNIVGRPMSILMSNSPVNCTVTVCHSKTKNLESICANADILIAALGKAEFVKANMVKEGAVVIDVGITRIEDKSTKSGTRLVGDVAYEEVKDKCSFITPVPGGVGPMTVYSLMMNTLRAYNKEVYA